MGKLPGGVNPDMPPPQLREGYTDGRGNRISTNTGPKGVKADYVTHLATQTYSSSPPFAHGCNPSTAAPSLLTALDPLSLSSLPSRIRNASIANRKRPSNSCGRTE